MEFVTFFKSKLVVEIFNQKTIKFELYKLLEDCICKILGQNNVRTLKYIFEKRSWNYLIEFFVVIVIFFLI